MNLRLLKTSILFSLLVVAFSSCEKEKKECPGSIQKEYNITGFDKIEAGETFHVDIQKGASFSVKASGCSDDLEDLTLSVGNGNILHVGYQKYRKNRYRVDLTITLPILIAVNMSGASKATVNGFSGQQSVIRNVLSGTAECTVVGAAVATQFDLSGTAKLTVSGTTLSLYGNLNGDSRLYTYDLATTEVDIDASGTSKAYVSPQEKMFAAASGDSRIYYKGNPSVMQTEISGTAKVIKE